MMLDWLEKWWFWEVKTDQDVIRDLKRNYIHSLVWYSLIAIFVATLWHENMWWYIGGGFLGLTIGVLVQIDKFTRNPEQLHAYRLKHFDERAIFLKQKWGNFVGQWIFIIFAIVSLAAMHIDNIETLRHWLFGGLILSTVLVILSQVRFK